jgi:hypothetical protein
MVLPSSSQSVYTITTKTIIKLHSRCLKRWHASGIDRDGDFHASDITPTLTLITLAIASQSDHIPAAST